MRADRRALGVIGVTILALVALAWLYSTRADEVTGVLKLFPLWALAACTALHCVTLFARSEAWRLSLRAIDGVELPRTTVHSANAAAFCAGALMSHCAMPIRVALLRRFAGSSSPRIQQIVVADAPICLLEIFCASALLLFAGVLWALPVAIVLLVAVRMVARRLEGRPAARGLAALCDRRLATRLGSWVGVITLAGVARVWLVLSLLPLGSGAGAVSSTFASLGVFGLLPLGPSSPAAGAVTASGPDQVAAGLAAGLVVAASTLLAVALYAVALGCWHGGKSAVGAGRVVFARYQVLDVVLLNRDAAR